MRYYWYLWIVVTVTNNQSCQHPILQNENVWFEQIWITSARFIQSSLNMEAMFDCSPNIGTTRPSKYPKQNPMFSTFTIFGLYLEGVLLRDFFIKNRWDVPRFRARVCMNCINCCGVAMGSTIWIQIRVYWQREGLWKPWFSTLNTTSNREVLNLTQILKYWNQQPHSKEQ